MWIDELQLPALQLPPEAMPHVDLSRNLQDLWGMHGQGDGQWLSPRNGKGKSWGMLMNEFQYRVMYGALSPEVLQTSATIVIIIVVMNMHCVLSWTIPQLQQQTVSTSSSSSSPPPPPASSSSSSSSSSPSYPILIRWTNTSNNTMQESGSNEFQRSRAHGESSGGRLDKDWHHIFNSSNIEVVVRVALLDSLFFLSLDVIVNQCLTSKSKILMGRCPCFSFFSSRTESTSTNISIYFFKPMLHVAKDYVNKT